MVLTWAIHRTLPNVIISQKRALPQTGSISSCSSASVSSVCPLSLELIRAHHLSCTLSKTLRLQPPPTSSPQPYQKVTHSVSHHMPMLPDYPLLSLMLHNTRMALSLSTYMRQVRNAALTKAQILRGCEASLQPVILTLFFSWFCSDWCLVPGGCLYCLGCRIWIGDKCLPLSWMWDCARELCILGKNWIHLKCGYTLQYSIYVNFYILYTLFTFKYKLINLQMNINLINTKSLFTLRTIAINITILASTPVNDIICFF